LRQLQHRQTKVVLAWEVVVEGAFPDARGCQEIVQRGGAKARLVGELRRLVEDTLLSDLRGIHSLVLVYRPVGLL
jgi:hypothetical protein